MKISEYLKQETLSISFEVFPPKASADYSSVQTAVDQIAALKPGFMSVTYGAGGRGGAFTRAIAQTIQQNHHVPALAHLTCVSSTAETMQSRMEELCNAGIENVLALRGDLPADLADADRNGWAYHNAVDLVRELKRFHPDFCIGGACYPEIHPESANQREDIRHLKEKVDAGCDFLTTQMFFDNNLFYNFLYKIRETGIQVPVLPGIMPITNAKQVARAISLSGSLIPQRFKSLVDRFGPDPNAMKQAGIAYATDQIIDLFANGIKHIHIYTMNKPEVAAQIKSNLSAILGRDFS